VWGSDEMLNDPLVARRCGSTDILDAKKMRTLFMDYPDSGRRYKLRFNVAGCDPKSVRVSTDGDRIVVRATRCDEDGEREYCRKIQKPKDVDHNKFKAYLSSDSVLVVEAPVPPSSINLRKVSLIFRLNINLIVLYIPASNLNVHIYIYLKQSAWPIISLSLFHH